MKGNAMAYKVQYELPCVGCGEMTYRRLRKTKDAMCLSCAIKKQEEWSVNLHYHTGEAQESWVDGMIRAANR